MFKGLTSKGGAVPIERVPDLRNSKAIKKLEERLEKGQTLKIDYKPLHLSGDIKRYCVYVYEGKIEKGCLGIIDKRDEVFYIRKIFDNDDFEEDF